MVDLFLWDRWCERVCGVRVVTSFMTQGRVEVALE